MTPERLVLEVLSVAKQIHPEYTHEQRSAWALGFLAKYVLRKNHMDNVIFAELNHELNLWTESHKYEDKAHKHAQAKR